MADGETLQTSSGSRHAHAPDFIIGGSPKCGTTTLHDILTKHPDIGIPRDEVMFFDADDPMVHGEYFRGEGEDFSWFDPSLDNQERQNWYAKRFEPFEGKSLIGEDSTSYLSSESAPIRVAQQLPNVKMIFLLRDPVARAYSHYWHIMKMGRGTVCFERALTRYPAIIRGSSYAPAIKRWYDALGRDRVLVLLFEDLVRRPQETLDRVTDFLGASSMELPTEVSWTNRTLYPKNVATQKLLNRLGRPLIQARYKFHMGGNKSLFYKFVS
ncbi:MAG: sulfotransferase, partial [Pseudomonadota bacterium]